MVEWKKAEGGGDKPIQVLPLRRNPARGKKNTSGRVLLWPYAKVFEVYRKKIERKGESCRISAHSDFHREPEEKKEREKG